MTMWNCEYNFPLFDKWYSLQHQTSHTENASLLMSYKSGKRKFYLKLKNCALKL